MKRYFHNETVKYLDIITKSGAFTNYIRIAANEIALKIT
jgi:hypothetical protein